MIDKALIIRKMNLIAPDLEKMVHLAAAGLPKFLEDPVSEDLAERYLERAIGRMIDVNYHLITELGHPPPRDYYDSFIKLGELGLIPKDLAKKVAACAGLRNRIAHEYDDIDPVLIFTGLSSAVVDVPQYLHQIEKYVSSLTKPGSNPL
jgi:uncharacterized protein YutE (UPF0331/DUF86 family)